MKQFARWGVIALVAVGLLLALGFPQQVFQNPLDLAFALEYPSFATRDLAGNVFVIDKSLSRIRKQSPDGALLFQIDGQSRTPGTLFYAVELTVDEGGFLYVLNQSMQENGFYTEREDILRYDPSGKFDRLVGSRVYSVDEIDNTNVTRGRLTGLSYAKQNIVWFELGRTGIIENTVDTNTWRLDQKVAAVWPDSMSMVASVTRIDADALMVSTKQGTIVKISRDGQREVQDLGDTSVTGLSVPWWTGTDNQGQLLFSDLTRGAILRLSGAGAPSVVLDAQRYRQATGDSLSPIFYTFAPTLDGGLITTNDRVVLSLDSQGRLETTTGGHLPLTLMAVRFFLWFGALAAVWLAGMGLVLIFRHLLGRRISLIAKQLMVLLPLMTGLLFLVSWTLIENFTARSETQAFYHLSQAIQVISQSIDSQRLDRIRNQSDFMNDDYRFIRNQLHTALNHNRDPWNNKFYFALHRLHEGTIYTSMYLNDGVGLFHPFAYLNDPTNLYWRAAKGEIATARIPDAWGTWVLGVGPIYNSKGEVSGLLEVGRDLYGFQRDTDAFLWSMAPFVGGGFVILILLSVFSTWFFLEPLRRLRLGANSIAQGQWDVNLPIRGSDEVAELTVVFNRMTAYIRNYIDEILALSQGYRFSPQDFLVHLQKESDKEIRKGDQVQREMTVMLTDVRAFTSVGGTLSPQESFDFLSRYLGMVSPEVRKNEGFVDKYIGNAILALFPRSPDDALEAAVAILNRLGLFNRERTTLGLPQVRIGLGIHTGLLMIGILGEQERLEATVISDNVNLASRLEGLTKFFDASIIVSDITYLGVKNPARFQFRSLGRVKVKGKRDPVGIYEVLDGLPEDVRTKKALCQQNLEAGIALYQNQDFEAAQEEFQVALGLSPEDTTVRVYLTLCRHALATPPTGEWSGAITMNSR